MLTRNGKCFCHLNSVASRTVGSGNITRFIQSNNGDYCATSTDAYVQTMASLALYAGTGNTTPSSSDISISNPNAGLTPILRTNTLDENGKNPDPTQDYIGVFSVTYRNDTVSDITVSEIGLIGTFPGVQVSLWYILAAREVIDPVTIAPGEAYTFTMYIG